ncbi:hypothetical protein SD81_017150 [Tolypothrix campylonemoides VB511288]|nr:hypothetical protein SD81_017150 [Tolypothrix campylonemoides VB511288]
MFKLPQFQVVGVIPVKKASSPFGWSTPFKRSPLVVVVAPGLSRLHRSGCSPRSLAIPPVGVVRVPSPIKRVGGEQAMPFGLRQASLSLSTGRLVQGEYPLENPQSQASLQYREQKAHRLLAVG